MRSEPEPSDPSDHTNWQIKADARKLLYGRVGRQTIEQHRIRRVGQASDAAVSRIVALLESARTSLTADVAQATVLATRPLGPLLAEMDVTDAAAWTVAGNVLMNLDEFPAKR